MGSPIPIFVLSFSAQIPFPHALGWNKDESAREPDESWQSRDLAMAALKGRWFPLQSLCPRGRSGLWKSAHAGATGVKNNERFTRAGKANVWMENGLKSAVPTLSYVLQV
jgi:hypothetical protein